MRVSLKDVISRYVSWNVLWFVLFGVGMGLFLVYSPKVTDDYWYMNHLQSWFAEQGILYPEGGGNIFKYGIPFRDIITIWEQHWEMDNIRLGNLIAPVFLLGPKWFSSGLMLIVLLAWVYMLGKFVGLDLKRSALVGLGLSLAVFVLPWREQFGSLVFQLNYVGGCLFGVLVLRELFMDKSAACATDIIKMFGLGFVTFWWQEAIGFPLLIAVGVLLLCYKRFTNLHNFSLIFGLGCGIIMILLCPGMNDRTNNSLFLSESETSLGNLLMIWIGRLSFIDLPYVWIPAVLVAVTGLFASIKVGFGRIWADPKTVLCVTSAAVSVIMMQETGSQYRGGWWYYLMVCVGIVYFLKSGFGDFWSRYRLGNCIIWCPFLLGCYIHLASVGYVVAQVRKDIERCFYEGIENPEKNRFVKYAYMYDFPLAALYMPFSWKFVEYYDTPLIWYRYGISTPWNYRSAPIEFGRGGIPVRLRNVTSGSGTLLEGDWGVRTIEGHLFRPASEKEIEETASEELLYIPYLARVNFGKRDGIAEVHGILFRSEGDGKIYMYIRPCFDWYVMHFKTLREIDKVGRKE